jgi:hypothetical protein
MLTDFVADQMKRGDGINWKASSPQRSRERRENAEKRDEEE